MTQDMKAIAKKMKKKGRFGDSELVHVNPSEKKMLLDMRGGIGTKNPDTGLDEFFNIFRTAAKLVPTSLMQKYLPGGDVIIPALTGALGGPMASAAQGAIYNYGETGDVGSSLKRGALNGALSYVGNGFTSAPGALGFGSVGGIGDIFGSLPSNVQGPTPSGASLGDGSGISGMIGRNLGISSDSPVSASAPVGAAEQIPSGVSKFLKSPQGMALGLSAIGMLVDSDNKDPYADEAAKKRAADNNYVRYSGGMVDPHFAKGGSVHTESDATYQLRPDSQQENDARRIALTRSLENKIGRRLDDDEMQDLMNRINDKKQFTNDEIMGFDPIRRASGGPVAGIGSGKSDDIPAMLSDGEHVITADEVSMLGDGSNDAGHKKLYAMRKKLRKHKTGRTKQMPMAKSPESYAGIGA